MRRAPRPLLLARPCGARVRALGGVLVGLLAGAAATPVVQAATPAELGDFEAQAEYAFFTEDAHALRELIRSGQALADSGEPRVLYPYAFAQFRALQLATFQAQAHEAETAGAACVDTLERALEKEPRFAEALALQAACLAYVGAAGRLRALTARPRSAARLEAAQALAPSNPRVLLVGALVNYLPDDAPAAQRTGALAQFERAAALFETVTATEPGEPTWGAAEAWLFVGRAREQRGELLAARTAYEKALLVAPDFARARRRLAALTSRR
jgi:tetratricopeptide (TPR) repeat protein